ncbi:MAG: DUF4258 domain-containing protein [Chloroflexi bacterium CG_4_10_14_0_8_um_filter_46_9]|nr:MAG: DUF4258 domain-containing protein [Chloroflexi bacterium CG15_BIG_FIL_POST_REV_8_21_14_020_46_15]PIZ26914.1 MAG: DUF4258 domain-containing protein [Chloroflexi bacterium CG_4_10_14_0_8_um_filter_46_9]
MKAIKFSEHALLKLKVMGAHGVYLNIEIVEDAVNYPQKIATGYKGRKIAQKELDLAHVLRVVYEE